MKHCKEERTEDVLGNLEAVTQQNGKKKIHQTTVFEGQFLNESHHFSPWAGPLSCFSRKAPPSEIWMPVVEGYEGRKIMDGRTAGWQETVMERWKANL